MPERTIAFALLFVALAAVPAAAQEIPWDLVEGSDELGAAHREVAAEVLLTAHAYGECKGTIASCLVSSPDDEIALRLAAFVVRRAAADNDVERILMSVENRKNSAIPPRMYEPDLTGLVPSGNPDAPVQVVLYADFECPYCGVASLGLREISLARPDEVAFYFKNFPLKSHARSVPAALAYLAAVEQGKGWEMHDLLFQHNDDLSDAVFEECAAEIGLDLERFRADMADKALIDRLRAEKTEGMKAGIKKSPGVMINGKRYFGVKTPVELQDRIEEEIYLLGLEG